MSLPIFYTPNQVAQHLGWTERLVRSEARRLGACRVMGKTMILLEEDVETILEATKCRSSSTAVTESGITAELLVHLSGARGCAVRSKPKTSRRPRGRLPKSKPDTGKVIRMDQHQS
jgi:hypothetical protein